MDKSKQETDKQHELDNLKIDFQNSVKKWFLEYFH